MQFSRKKSRIPLSLLTIILVASILVITGGVLIYHTQKNKILVERNNELAAISSLKISEIQKWRMEHIRDGMIISEIMPENKVIASFFANPDQENLRQDLLKRMKAFIADYDYHSILFLDTKGKVILAYPAVDTAVVFPALTESESNGITFSDVNYSNDLPGIIHIDMKIPLLANDQKVFGSILMRIDPQVNLYPMIQSWPTPSKSSETLLVRIDGDSILYLNDLKYKANTALKFKLPITSSGLPGIKAITGYEGIFQGIDYRGKKVFSIISKVPDSPWYMITKIDKDEVYEPLLEHIFLIFSIVFLLILSITIIIIYYWKIQNIRYLKELNLVKDKFFSIVSHDLRSPFVSIMGFSDLLIEEVNKKSSVKLKEYAELIQSSSHNAMDLLINLTEWSRIQTNRIAYNPKEIDLETVINEVTGLMSYSALQKSITIHKNIPSKLRIKADREMISSVLRNLISNSIKFSNPGGNVCINVNHDDHEVIVEVKDFGVGIKKTDIDKILENKEIVSLPGTKGEHGTGLGLLLVKEFILMHNGRVWVDSETGKFTSFYFALKDF
jgi:signal transduction histidine kinase